MAWGMWEQETGLTAHLGEAGRSRVRGGVLPQLNYELGCEVFGRHGVAELIYLVGLYCLVSVTLNGFDVPVPSKDA